MKLKSIFLVATLFSATSSAWSSQCYDYKVDGTIKRFTAIGYGAAGKLLGPGVSVGQSQLMAMRAGKMDAYRSMAEMVYGFKINGTTTISSMVIRNDNFRVYVDAHLRGAELVSIQPIGKGSYEVTVELSIMVPTSLDDMSCLEKIEDQEVQDDYIIQESGDTTVSTNDDNFLTKIVRNITDPILSPEQNPMADFNDYETVPPEDRISYSDNEEKEVLSSESTKSTKSTNETIEDGLNMELVESVRANQENASILLREAILAGMDREVAVASVLTGMVEPTQLELENVINQAVALGLNRDEADRAVNRVKQVCSVCNELENPAAEPIKEISSGPVAE